MSNLVFCPNCEWNLKYNIIGEKYCSHCEYTEVTPLNFDKKMDSFPPKKGDKVIAFHMGLGGWAEVEYLEYMIKPVGYHKVIATNGEILITCKLDCMVTIEGGS